MSSFCFSKQGDTLLDNKYFRNPRTHNEMTQIDSETSCYIRGKRSKNNLPTTYSDLRRCEDKDTNRQIRMSRNNFKVSIKHLPVMEPFSVLETVSIVEDS
jgi:hypothetical protein